MIDFKLSDKLDQSKVFLFNLSQIEGRLDPSTYHQDRLNAIKRLKSSGVELKPLKFLVSPNKESVKSIPTEETIYVGLENIESDTGYYIPTTEKDSISSALVFKKGDILFPKLRPYLNKVFYATFDGICSTEFHVFKSGSLDNEYLSHFLRSKLVVSQTEKLMSGNTLPRVQTEDIYNLLIPVISPEKQSAVVAFMDKAKSDSNTLKGRAELLLAEIDSYILNELGITLPEKDTSIKARMFQTTFQELSGRRFDPKLFDTHSKNLFAAVENAQYPKEPLKNLITHSAAGDWGIDEEAEVKEDQYDTCLVIRATEFDNLYNLKLENDRVRHRKIKKDKLKQLDIQPYDLLIEKSGGSPDQPVGRISLLTEDLFENNTLCYSNFIHKIRVDTSRVDPSYLFCFLKTIHNIKITEIMQSQTNGIRNLIMGEYFNQSIVLPKLDKQIEIGKEANRRRFEAQRLSLEANKVLEDARAEIEQMILE
tara:strand:+ start:1059 stop:2498 length:1440 start_codon:yes stop_codon:yes gene_type:complete